MPGCAHQLAATATAAIPASAAAVLVDVVGRGLPVLPGTPAAVHTMPSEVLLAEWA